MKEQAKKEKFIFLRAQGLSFDRIAEEIHASKQTLINWSKDLKEEINNLKAFNAEALQEKYQLKSEDRLQQMAEVHQKIRTELEKRDFSDISTEKLFSLFLKSNEYIGQESFEPVFLDDVEIAREKRYKDVYRS